MASIDLNAFDLWGVSAIGETFIFVGKLPLIFHGVPDVPGLMPLFLLLRQKNKQLLLLPKQTRVDP